MDRNGRRIVFSNASRLSSASNPGIFGKHTTTASIRVRSRVSGSMGLFQCYSFPRISANPRMSLRKPFASETRDVRLFVPSPSVSNSFALQQKYLHLPQFGLSSMNNSIFWNLRFGQQWGSSKQWALHLQLGDLKLFVNCLFHEEKVVNWDCVLWNVKYSFCIFLMRF